MKPVVLVTRKLPEAVEARLRRDYEPILNPADELYDGDRIIEEAAGADAILPCHTEKFTATVIERLPERVKIIANFSVGYDHVDVAAAKKRGLVVTNTPEVLSDATAELTILLMLGAARRASEGERLVRNRGWRDWSQVVARRARAFDMEIHYHNRHRVAPELEAGAIYHDTPEGLLPHCDFLALHCVASPQTEKLLNAERIALLPDGAIVVNASRGVVIDDEALIAALKSGKLYAAGLDVFNNEPDINPAYRDLDNVFLMPHIGSATKETRDAMGFRALDNLDAYFGGKEPKDRVA
ncbi:D-glycerate dehydrogenase [bacterium]|nr:D-glycerate dehydrogenase [bacterium]